MDVLEVIRTRWSCRRWADQPLPDRVVETLVGAALRAPSAGNLQPWRIVLVGDPDRREALAAAACEQRFVARAPLVVVMCAVPEESGRVYGSRGRELYCLQDTAAAVENLLLAATGIGLGACWVGAFDERRVSGALGLPVGWRPVALVPVGWPGEDPPAPSTRRSASEVLRRL